MVVVVAFPEQALRAIGMINTADSKARIHFLLSLLNNFYLLFILLFYSFVFAAVSRKSAAKCSPCNASGVSTMQCSTASAVARLVASGTLWTSQTRSKADTSGSCGWAVRASRRKITASTVLLAIKAPTCWSPPKGPLCSSCTGRPVRS